MKRLAIYVFWEKNGIVRDYVTYYLRGLAEVTERRVVVVNGEITNEGRTELLKIGCEVLQRPNIGYDFWAYKHGIDTVGKDLYGYDEIILCNCSCYGPIHPFDEMFSIMSGRGLDFWGVTNWPKDTAGYIGTWVLSYFIVFSQKLVSSNSWQKWWRELEPTETRDDTIRCHETKLTKYFSDFGFIYDVYCPLISGYVDMTIDAVDYIVSSFRCPLIKKKAFSEDYSRYLAYTRGGGARKAYDFIYEHNNELSFFILSDLLATQNYYNVYNSLHLNQIISVDSLKVNNDNNTLSVAIFAHLYYEDLLQQNIEYLASSPVGTDIYITTSVGTLVPVIREVCNKYKILVKSIDVINARGRADSAFLVHNRKRILSYDIVCTVHDKKSSFLIPGSVGLEFGWHNMDSLLKNKNYVLNIISIFSKRPEIGIICPPNVIHGPFDSLYGQEWGSNFDGVKSLLEKFDIDVPISPDIPPIAPMGAMFWFRPQALKKLLDYPWSYKDFPQEPMPLDGAIIHIVERSYSFFAQNAGYLTVSVTDIYDSRVQMTNLAYLLRKSNIKANQLEQQLVSRRLETIREVRTVIKEVNMGLRHSIKEYFRKVLPNSWIMFIRKIRQRRLFK